MSIRKAERKDTKDIMRLLLQISTLHHTGRPDLFNIGTKYTSEQLCEIMEDEKRPIFVYEKDGNILGYAFCIFRQFKNDTIMTDIKTLYIDDLCVDENVRGQNIGTKLYEYVLDYAKKSGCYNVTLNVWTMNEKAIEFYKKCGLKPQKIGMETIL